MGISYRLDRDCSVPVIRCDECEGEIREGSGNVLFQSDPPLEPYVTPVFVHKGNCDRAYQRIHGHMSWDELSHWYLFLADNTGLTNEVQNKARENLLSLAEAGFANYE